MHWRHCAWVDVVGRDLQLWVSCLWRMGVVQWASLSGGVLLQSYNPLSAKLSNIRDVWSLGIIFLAESQSSAFGTGQAMGHFHGG
jgi:hypothetical protein